MGDALLAAILANPDDLAARAVYADRLLEAGDPRGELIQVQCAIAATTLDEVPAELRARETKLLAKHEAAWLAPLEPLVKRATFARGFPELLEVDATKLVAGARALAKLTPIASLEITGVTTANAPALAACKLLARVSALSFARAKLTAKLADIVFAKLRLTQTRALTLATNPKLDDGGHRAVARALAGTTALRELDLEETHLTARGIEALLEANPRGLTHLALLRNPLVAGAGIEALAASPILATVRDLNLFDCNLGRSLAALAASPHLGALEQLTVHRNAIPDATARSFLAAAKAGRFPKLAGVWIHDNALSDRTAAAFATRFPRA